MSDLIQRLGILSLTSSAVLLPLLLLAPRIQKRYAAKSLYLLWLLLSVRLLLPVELDLPRPAVTIRVPEVTYTVPAAPAAQAPVTPVSPVPAPAAPAVEPAPAAAPTVSLGQLLFGIWLSGAVLFLAWNAVGCTLARRDLLRGAGEELGDQLMLAKLWEGEHGRPAVLRSFRAAGAISLGLFRPVVVLPEGLGPGRETEMVLRHELGHIRRRDLWYKFLLLLVNAVHWFNPLVWSMCRQAARNLEYCCDDWVVRDQDAEFRHSYGEVLLRHASGRGTVPLYATRFGGGGELRGRIVNLFAVKKTGAVLVSLVLCAALAAGSLVACESVRAGEGVSYTRKGDAFTLRLPESWAGQFEAVDTTSAQTKFYLSGDEGVSLVTMLCISLEEYPGFFPPEQERVGYRMRELGPVGDRMVVLLDYGDTGYPEEQAALREILVEELWNMGPAALETDGPVYENGEYGFTLRLPESWEGRFEVTADETGCYVFRDIELGDGGGIFGLSVYPQPLPEEEQPARIRFLGGREGCWVYADLRQSDGPALSAAPEEAVGRYDTMYEDLLRWLDAAPTCLLTFRGGDPSDVEATPALTAREALDELAASVLVTGDELAFTIPMGYPVSGDWKLQAAGRYDDGMGMAVHILDNDGNQTWEAGETYRFPLKEYDLAKFTELSLNAWLPDGQGGELEKQVDLLVRAEELRAQMELLDKLRSAEDRTTQTVAGALVQEEGVHEKDLYRSDDMGFSLLLPSGWMDRLTVDVREKNSAVFQYGAGGPILFAVQAVPTAEWETAQAGGRDTADTAILEVGVGGDSTYLLGYPDAAPEGADQTYRDMLALVPELARDFFPLQSGAEGTSSAEWQWPLPGRYQISANFGNRVHPVTGEKADHDGVDIPAPEGTAVQAAQGGVVLKSGFDSTYGNYVLLSHAGDLTTRYACLQSCAVAEGDRVQAGETVGFVGSTGASTGDHLHLVFAENGVRKDPLDYYPELAGEFYSGGAPSDSEETVIDVRCDGGRELTGYGTFAVEEGQKLTVAYATDAADGGKVDLFLYGPEGARRQLTFVKGSETRTVDLPAAGTWTYDCTGSSLSVCTASLVGTLS